MDELCPLLVPKNGQFHQPSTVIPPDRAGNDVSLQDRKNALLPALPATLSWVQAEEPGWAVTAPPAAADARGEDWGSPYIQPAFCPTVYWAISGGGAAVLLVTGAVPTVA